MRYASDSVGIFLSNKSLGPSFNALSLSWTLTHDEGSFSLYSSTPQAIYPSSIMDFWITHPPLCPVIPRTVVRNGNRQ